MKIQMLKDIQIGDVWLRKNDILDDKVIECLAGVDTDEVIEALLLLKQAEQYKENHYKFSLKHANDKDYSYVNACALCGKCDDKPLNRNCIFYDLDVKSQHNDIMMTYLSSIRRQEFIKFIEIDRDNFVKFIKNININDYKDK